MHTSKTTGTVHVIASDFLAEAIAYAEDADSSWRGSYLLNAIAAGCSALTRYITREERQRAYLYAYEAMDLWQKRRGYRMDPKEAAWILKEAHKMACSEERDQRRFERLERERLEVNEQARTRKREAKAAQEEASAT